ncbi:hypothetical protein OUZ56_033822 [Daphnia magna]|uniref:Uncharacterized protein n=1 Tax=Daphnia magna TaxID=35525 RepID=A0ABQ9ZYW5_9CRUS|nr:hypothetical protein OUZ56_033822 [Daphnia magna]
MLVSEPSPDGVMELLSAYVPHCRGSSSEELSSTGDGPDIGIISERHVPRLAHAGPCRKTGPLPRDGKAINPGDVMVARRSLATSSCWVGAMIKRSSSGPERWLGPVAGAVEFPALAPAAEMVSIGSQMLRYATFEDIAQVMGVSQPQ